MPLILFLNLGALLATLLIFFAAGAVLALGPQHLHISGGLAISLIVLAVGAALEFTPLRPRFFWVPFWLIGTGMTVWHLAKILT